MIAAGVGKSVGN